MSRAQLERLTVVGLREVASQHGLDSQEDQNPIGIDHAVSRPEITREGESGGAVRAFDMQEIVQAVMHALRDNSREEGIPLNTGIPRPGSNPSQPALDTTQGFGYNWGQIKFISKIVPSFSGKEDENVAKWIERVTSVARLHNIKDETLILAAVNQLRERALEWYNRQPVDTVATWENLKFELRRYFERKESYTTLLSRINNRHWKAHYEKCIEYAEDTLKLMQILTLTEKETIDFLAGGVKDPLLRGLVLNTWFQSVPEFIEHVRKITEDGLLTKRSDAETRTGDRKAYNHKEKLCSVCNRVGHVAKDCRIGKPVCYRCGQSGHINSNCPKKGTKPTTSLSHVIEEKITPTRSEEITPVLKIGANGCEDPCIIVRSLNKDEAIFRALIDTGSPVNLIKLSAYRKYYKDRELFRVKTNTEFKGVNDAVIVVRGKLYEQIELDSLKGQWFDITLLVVEDKTMSYDMILGREFLIGSKLKLIYNNGKFIFENANTDNYAIESILSINAIEEKDKFDLVSDNLDPQLDIVTREKLISVLQEGESIKIDPVNDNYNVRVHIRDPSLFRYAPRRLSYTEKRELDEITDDLLKEGIIKPSISPYCARVILVAKKNGKKTDVCRFASVKSANLSAEVSISYPGGTIK